MTDSDPDNSYRPRSPDISNFQPSYAQQQYIEPYTHQPGYSPPNNSTSPQASYDASPFFNRQQYFPPQPQQPAYTTFDSYQPQEMPPITRSRAAHAQSYAQEPQPHYAQTHHTHPPQLSHPQPLQQQQQQQQQAWHPPPAPEAGEEPQTKVAKPNATPAPAPPAAQAPSPAPGPGPSQGIEIKTKFPVARIKRIMQADEDVGKVAQVTPVAVSKALELFMITLVTKAAEQAKARSSKRITATHLKEAVLRDEHFDFLHEIMSKVPDQQAKKDDDGSDHNDGRKRRGGGGGRRRKDEHGDE